MEHRIPFVGYDAAAAITGFSKPTLYSMVSRKQIPHYRMSRRCVRFSVEELESWIAARRVPVAGVVRPEHDLD